MTSTRLQGGVEPGFGPVADAFEQTLAKPGELGAAFALYVDGRLVVDVWGGVADKRTRQPWTERTLQLVFSSTKGATALCLARLVGEGRLSYDDPVAAHWPEFSAGGKHRVTVGELVSHQAGLIAVDTPLTFEQVLEVEPVVAALAAQAPLWPPGTGHGYHALTFGWLVGELVQRVDGRTLGRYFAEEVAAPLGLDFWIGLPESEEHRVSTIARQPMPDTPEEIAAMAAQLGKGTNGYRATTLDGVIRMAPENHFNLRALHATEMPGANGITDARSLARLYAAMIGDVDGVRVLPAEMVDVVRTERVHGPDLTLIRDTRFGAGFWLDEPGTPMLGDGSFGHPGAGGSLGYANPELGVGYGYVMNQMRGGLTGDRRTVTLNRAVLDCL